MYFVGGFLFLEGLDDVASVLLVAIVAEFVDCLGNISASFLLVLDFPFDNLLDSVGSEFFELTQTFLNCSWSTFICSFCCLILQTMFSFLVFSIFLFLSIISK